MPERLNLTGRSGGFTFSGMEDSTFSRAMFFARQEGPGVAERVDFWYRLPGVREWSLGTVEAAKYGDNPSHGEWAHVIEGGDWLNLQAQLMVGNKDRIPRGKWRARLVWRSMPNTVKERRKTWAVNVDVPVD